MELLGLTLDAIGKLMVAYTAVSVHYRFWKEHKVDERVFAAMRHERTIGLWGIAFMVAGYFLQILYKT